jgi:hypothetical protein
LSHSASPFCIYLLIYHLSIYSSIYFFLQILCVYLWVKKLNLIERGKMVDFSQDQYLDTPQILIKSSGSWVQVWMGSIYLFSGTGVWIPSFTFTWATLPVLFCEGFCWHRVSWIICPGWFQTSILLISASWVAGITSVRHQCPKYYSWHRVLLYTQGSLDPDPTIYDSCIAGMAGTHYTQFLLHEIGSHKFFALAGFELQSSGSPLPK